MNKILLIGSPILFRWFISVIFTFFGVTYDVTRITSLLFYCSGKSHRSIILFFFYFEQTSIFSFSVSCGMFNDYYSLVSIITRHSFIFYLDVFFSLNNVKESDRSLYMINTPQVHSGDVYYRSCTIRVVNGCDISFI